MARVNLNKLALAITQREGKKVNVSNAQVKEILKITLELMKQLTVEEVAELMKRTK